MVVSTILTQILLKFVHEGAVKSNIGSGNIDLARNGNSRCANEILGCAKFHF